MPTRAPSQDHFDDSKSTINLLDSTREVVLDVVDVNNDNVYLKTTGDNFRKFVPLKFCQTLKYHTCGKNLKLSKHCTEIISQDSVVVV